MELARFKNAIVRQPCKNMVNGLSSLKQGIPDYQLALKQHQDYVNALKLCGLQVEVLEAIDDYPDSTFIEDIALLTPHCAIITNPGAPTRRGEIHDLPDILKKYYHQIEYIREPGTIEAGDIMMVGDHFYIGLSERTNKDGAHQMAFILAKYKLGVTFIPLKEMLHLKTGVAYLEDNKLLVTGEFVNTPEFDQFNKLVIDTSESYAANCIWVNHHVIIPKGYPHAKQQIEKNAYKTIEVDVSEFKKLDGGMSCLSLRF